MTRIERAALLLVVALCAVGAVVAPLLGGRSHSPALLQRGQDARIVLAELAPSHPFFADPVVATLEIAVDRRRVDPSTVEVLVDPRPYRTLETRRSVSGDGRTAIVRFEFRLRCLRLACRGAIALRDPVVLYAGHDARVHELNASWPALSVHSRLSQLDRATAQAGHPPFELQAGALAARGSARNPTLVAALLAAASALLVAGAAFVVGRPLLLRRRTASAPVSGEPEPFARALGALESACAPPPGDVRPQALDLVARALDARDEAELAGEARALAWSREAIDDDRVAALLARCRLLEAGE